MAAITKSAVKSRSRGEIPSFCVIAIILCVGTIQGFLTLNQDYLADTPESLADSPLFSINVEKKSLPPPSQSQEKEILPENPFPKTNEDYFRNPSVHLDKKIYMFHHTLSTPDGTEGAIILDMLMAHAHVYHQGGIYSGSCGDGNDVGREPENKLIRAIGLKYFLQFACPRDVETTDRKKVLPSKSYIADGTRVFTPEYVNLLKSVIKYPKREESQKKTNTIVVHIKRGRKITPCKKLYRDFEPYLPNKHFQLLIDKYSKDGYENKVIIYSQSSSFERFDEFRDKGYELHIDERIQDVWKSVLLSDVFIMSRSSFSFVPAMVANDETTKIVYTPFWYQPIRGWDIVRKDIQEQSDAELKRLKSTC